MTFGAPAPLTSEGIVPTAPAESTCLTRKRVAVVMGTRPEAIKMAPVVHALRASDEHFETIVVATAQHRQMLDQVLSIFQIRPDIDLNLMRQNQSLSELAARVLTTMDETLRELKPDLLMVQGDTTTVLATAIAAFHLGIPVAHVEAGLRSHDMRNPFPEEMNRRLTSVLTEVHFAPTPLARRELLHEGVAPERIIVTGNTVVDALEDLLKAPFDLQGSPLAGIPFEGHRVLVVTSHRRESWGQDLENTCLAIRDLIERFPDLLVVYPVHLNPNVRKTVMTLLGDGERIHLTEPLDYFAFVNLMRRCHLILTDSGGVQEEAPTLGKPLLVLRKLTERPEAFQAGLSKVVGNSRSAITEEASRLLENEQAYAQMVSRVNPFGDGHAAQRITLALERWRTGGTPLLSPVEQFHMAES
ncbi:MAG: UDP-N-acetylglucosamine 2-epimerase (non-hydrolyzing) [Rhodospirillales bacterium]|nr:UDP-N-acetylglucosamine 2-epimerase (non-hydrolyzing) [Rhodospirillales bacterium]